VRVRQSLGRIYAKQGYNVQAFYILRQALFNFRNFAEGKHSKLAETGFESEDKGTMKVPDMYNVAPAG